MQITSSYSVEIRKQDLCFRKTFEVYRSAAAYLIPVFDSVWEELEETGGAKRRFNAAEHLVHSTKKNTARFDFDLRLLIQIGISEGIGYQFQNKLSANRQKCRKHIEFVREIRYNIKANTDRNI